MRSIRRLIRAARIKGDLDLGLEATRLGGDGDKLWGKIDSPGGLIPGGSEQGILEISATQNYRIGTRRVIDERVFRYGRADSARQLRAAYGCYGNLLMTETGNPAADAALGATSLTATAVGTVAADQFEGGTMVVSSAGGGGYGVQYRIKGNTAAAPAATFTVYLEDGLVAALTTSDTITLYRSPYADVHCMRQEVIDGAAPNFRRTSVIGVPPRFVTAAYYCWLQTWGPCYLVMSHSLGGTNDQRMLVFTEDGSIGDLSDVEAAGTISYDYQMAGPLLPVTTAGNAVPDGLALTMLQISP